MDEPGVGTKANPSHCVTPAKAGAHPEVPLEITALPSPHHRGHASPDFAFRKAGSSTPDAIPSAAFRAELQPLRPHAPCPKRAARRRNTTNGIAANSDIQRPVLAARDDVDDEDPAHGCTQACRHDPVRGLCQGCAPLDISGWAPAFAGVTSRLGRCQWLTDGGRVELSAHGPSRERGQNATRQRAPAADFE